jgi:hypothetical protein
MAAARISHPNVIPMYEVGEAAGHIYIAMEYVEGITLRKWQAQQGRSWRETLAMYLQAGSGLEAAHQASVVHCDFKPDKVRAVDKAAESSRNRASSRGNVRCSSSQALRDACGHNIRGTELACRSRGTLMHAPPARCHFVKALGVSQAAADLALGNAFLLQLVPGRIGEKQPAKLRRQPRCVRL